MLIHNEEDTNAHETETYVSILNLLCYCERDHVERKVPKYG
jgi:hypothetical protein